MIAGLWEAFVWAVSHYEIVIVLEGDVQGVLTVFLNSGGIDHPLLRDARLLR